MLLNALLFPSVSQNRVTEVGYSEFLTMVDDGKVTEAAMDQQNNQIVFVTDDGNGNTAYYKTGIFPDDSLIDRLRENNVKNTIGVAFDIQVVDNMPVEEFDRPLSMIITEKRDII